MLKDYGTGKRGLSFLLTGIVAAATVVSLGFAQVRREGAQDETYEGQRAFGEARVKGGLREAARIRGDYAEDYDYHFHQVPTDIAGMTKNSELVITGLPVGNRCKLTKDGFIIHTVYDVTVQEVVKGVAVKPGDTIKVSLPGGKVKFKDGTTAETVTPHFEKMVNGKTYALYLRQRRGVLFEDPAITTVYNLTAGPQGLFELTADGSKVKSHAKPDAPAAKESEGKDVITFLTEARNLARRYPETPKCCE